MMAITVSQPVFPLNSKNVLPGDAGPIYQEKQE